MRILERIVFLTIVPLFFLYISCKPQSPVTPEGTFYELRNASLKNDINLFIKLLSKKSIDKIKTTSKVVSVMNEHQLKFLSGLYDIPLEGMKKFSVKTFIKIFLKKKQNIIVNALKLKIISIDIKNRDANVGVENGIKLKFIKEGLYWKFDMTNL